MHFVDIHFDLLMLPDYGVEKYDIGAGFGHFGIAVEDVSSCSRKISHIFLF